MLRVWNVLLVIGAFFLSIFGTFLTRSGILSSIHCVHGERHRAVVPRLPGHRPRRLARAPVRAAAAPALEDPARVARLARGDLPLQQPAARRAHADDPLGRRLPARVRGGDRRVEDRRARLLRLLRARLRAAAAAADGHRPARRLAARLAAQPRADVRLAGRGSTPRRARPARARGGLVDSRPDRVHVLHLRPRLHRARVHPRHARPPFALRRLVAGCLLRAGCTQPPALRRLRRARRRRPARDRDRRLERLRQSRRGEARARPDARRRRLPAHLPFARGARGRERDRDQGPPRRRARRRRRSGRSRRARTPTPRSGRSPTKSASAATSSRARICS